jgi:hypothetical protein
MGVEFGHVEPLEEVCDLFDVENAVVELRDNRVNGLTAADLVVDD